MAEATFDGCGADELRALLDLPRVEVHDSVTSTLDVAHALGESGAPAGSLVIAERQTAGRGREGRRWTSVAGSGIWLAMLERPTDAAATDVLAIRLGIGAARALDRFAESPVRLKWPNDLFVAAGKVCGILVESRWRDQRIEWVAVGIGINVRLPPDVAHAGALRAGASRVPVLEAVVPAIRGAAAAHGALKEAELGEYAQRDMARGRACRLPAPGVVQGIDARGSLLVATAVGDVTCRSGSLVFEEDA
ncbi:MAG TPA: biotin--[acetyl-CoA-carboxylase] ligase [Gemmatimonadaceae bacterium]|nr:biotin--[acetyl-CoA-carboxylase] ligase [Gemmatimonadaceae bacterium]